MQLLLLPFIHISASAMCWKLILPFGLACRPRAAEAQSGSEAASLKPSLESQSPHSSPSQMCSISCAAHLMTLHPTKDLTPHLSQARCQYLMSAAAAARV